MAFSKETELEEKDELHKEYGIFKNSIYTLKNIKKYKRIVLLLMLVGACTNAFMQYMWSFIGKFVIDIIERQANSPEKSLRPLVIMLCITAVIELTCLMVNNFCGHRIWYNFIYIRMKVIEERIAKALSMNYEMLENPKMLDRMEKAMNATGGNNNGIEGMMHSIHDFLIQCILIVIAITVISSLSPWLILVIVSLSFLQYLFFRYTVKKDKKETWDKLAPVWRKINYMEYTTQDFSYAKDIRLYRMKNWLLKKQDDILSLKYRHIAKGKDFWIYNSTFAHIINLIRNAIIYSFLIYSVLFRDLSIGNFTLYLASTMTFSNALTNLLNNMAQFKQRSMEVDDFRTFMEIEDPNDKKETIPVPKADSYEFVFENVSFKYEGQESYAVKNLNLTLTAGERLAVVGLNGAGKTTFIKLLLRLYDVTEGTILLNGTDIRNYDRGDYYKLFSPVFQNVEIFAFPMSENVSMKSPAETDAIRSEDCLRQAGMSEKIDSLTDGVHTELLKVIHENGIDLSGGEKQKLALARALYKDAPIVVLDEPTAALDALAEYKLYMDFDQIIGSKSAIYISHRLSSTRFCDHIAMFKDGEMIEYGTHDDLLLKGGAYADMFAVQAQYYIEDTDDLRTEVISNA